MPAVLVAVPNVTQNSVHPLSISSIIARHLVDFMVQGKITVAAAPTICLDATSSIIPPFLCQTPFLLHPSQFVLLGTGIK